MQVLRADASKVNDICNNKQFHFSVGTYYVRCQSQDFQ